MRHTRINEPILASLGGYSEFAAPPALNRYAALLWNYRSAPTSPPVPHRVLPSVGASLCVQYKAGKPNELQVLVLGPVAVPRVFLPEPGLIMEAVLFRPEWGALLLDADPSGLADTSIDLGTVSARRGQRLKDRAARSIADRGSALPALLTDVEERIDQVGREPLVACAAEGIRHIASYHQESRPLRLAADASSVSTRHLRRAIRRVTGMSPKYIQRVVRMMGLVFMADRVHRPAWASLAAAHGYFDQSHLTNECRELTGQTPVQLHKERWEEQVRFFQESPAAAY